MSSLNILLDDFLSAKSCSVLVIEVIKYVAYNTKQIPFSYEAFNLAVSRLRKLKQDCQDSYDEFTSILSLKQKKADSFLKQMSTIFESYEITFQKLQVELCSTNDVKEVMIVVGPTFFVPKHVLRIKIPPFANGSPSNVRKHLLSVYRQLQDCQELSDSLFNVNGPSNMYVLVGRSPDADFHSSWFLPAENVNFSKKVPQTIINLTSESTVSDTLQNKISTPSIEICAWYKSIRTLQGFKDYKIDGVSAINMCHSLSQKNET